MILRSWKGLVGTIPEVLEVISAVPVSLTLDIAPQGYAQSKVGFAARAKKGTQS